MSIIALYWPEYHFRALFWLHHWQCTRSPVLRLRDCGECDLLGLQEQSPFCSKITRWLTIISPIWLPPCKHSPIWYILLIYRPYNKHLWPSILDHQIVVWASAISKSQRSDCLSFPESDSKAWFSTEMNLVVWQKNLVGEKSKIFNYKISVKFYQFSVAIGHSL
jgi:hypothetical protein